MPPPQPGMKAGVEQHVYIGRNVQGVHGLVVPPHRLPAMVQQELLKVPPGDSGLWSHDSEHNMQSLASSPDIVLMEGFIKQVVGFLELFPHGRAPALEECVDGILVLAIDLQITCSVLPKWTDNTRSVLTSLLANISKLGTKSSPGLTCFSTANISLALAPGS